ncbi:MAG TPA: bifunctional DNA-formamidopyrimidine glycosylase/DNA-(apurinic or apyrimidinic site) lyase [Polyangiaceae bacterium]|nr:bifunctional DNA-formamidopyrimidine glycosylase/DNA-(apurinic or apyrimidinic site) lyase [Polyangiaceae bacterium]
MPELPEVEVVRRQLEPVWVGRRIVSVWTAKPSYFFVTPPKRLGRALEGRKTTALTRHGKYILAELDDDSRLLCHLGMTGQISSRPLERDGHVHLVLGLSGGRLITFRDVRKFGKVEWIAPGATSGRLDKLGPDALEADWKTLELGFAGRRVAVKSALLDQSVLAGVGNIYADEALFAARVAPTRAASSLSPGELRKLAREVRAILERSVAHGGSTINDYVQPDGELGGFQDWHRVYGRTNEPCPRCRQPIARLVLGGRSSHFCPNCQK